MCQQSAIFIYSRKFLHPEKKEEKEMREFQDGDKIVCTLLKRRKSTIGTFLELHDAKDKLVNWPNYNKDKVRLSFRICDFAMLHEFLLFIAQLNGFRLSLRSITDTEKVFVLHKIAP